MNIFNEAPTEPFLQRRSHMHITVQAYTDPDLRLVQGQGSTNYGHIWSISVPTRKKYEGDTKGKASSCLKQFSWMSGQKDKRKLKGEAKDGGSIRVPQ